MFLFVDLFSYSLRKKTVPFEQVEIFLNFSSFCLIKCQLLLRTRLLSLLEVDRVDVENSDQGEQEDTNIFSVDLKILKNLICFMDKCSFMTAFALFIYLNEAHLFQYFIKQHIVYFFLSRRGNIEELNDSIVLLDELLGYILFIIEIQGSTWNRNALKTLTFILPVLFLSPQGVFIKKLIYRRISGQLSTHIRNLGVKVLAHFTISIKIVLFVLQGVKAIENSPLFFSIFNSTVSLRFECVFSLFLSF